MPSRSVRNQLRFRRAALGFLVFLVMQTAWALTGGSHDRMVPMLSIGIVLGVAVFFASRWLEPWIVRRQVARNRRELSKGVRLVDHEVLRQSLIFGRSPYLPLGCLAVVVASLFIAHVRDLPTSLAIACALLAVGWYIGLPTTYELEAGILKVKRFGREIDRADLRTVVAQKSYAGNLGLINAHGELVIVLPTNSYSMRAIQEWATECLPLI